MKVVTKKELSRNGWPMEEAWIEDDIRTWTVTKSGRSKGKTHPNGHFTEAYLYVLVLHILLLKTQILSESIF